LQTDISAVFCEKMPICNGSICGICSNLGNRGGYVSGEENLDKNFAILIFIIIIIFINWH